LAIGAAVALAAAVPFLVFHARAPVLVVADKSFIGLYGETRMRRVNLRSSLSLFRPVKTVTVADDSGDDIVQYAVEEVSSSPFCVVFPFSFADAARLYREQNPLILVVLLEGRLENANSAGFDGIFIYKTDIMNDFYLAAAAVAEIDKSENSKIAVFVETQLQNKCKEAFLLAFNELNVLLEPVYFTSFSQFSENSGFSCVVLAGTGAEYFENNSGVPVVFFSWIDPVFMPQDLVLVIDDSPWVQLSQAVRMAAAGLEEGLIKSTLIVLNDKKIGANFTQKIKKMS